MLKHIIVSWHKSYIEEVTGDTCNVSLRKIEDVEAHHMRLLFEGTRIASGQPQGPFQETLRGQKTQNVETHVMTLSGFTHKSALLR